MIHYLIAEARGNGSDVPANSKADRRERGFTRLSVKQMIKIEKERAGNDNWLVDLPPSFK